MQWRVLSQLAAVVSGQAQLQTNSAALPWLMAIESRLGNTITEVSASSPKEWTVIRKSHIGLTGFELVALARWLESPGFPRPGVWLGPEPARPGHRPPSR